MLSTLGWYSLLGRSKRWRMKSTTYYKRRRMLPFKNVRQMCSLRISSHYFRGSSFQRRRKRVVRLRIYPAGNAATEPRQRGLKRWRNEGGKRWWRLRRCQWFSYQAVARKSRKIRTAAPPHHWRIINVWLRNPTVASWMRLCLYWARCAGLQRFPCCSSIL